MDISSPSGGRFTFGTSISIAKSDDAFSPGNISDYCYMYLPTTGIYFAPLLILDRNPSLALRCAVAAGCLAFTTFGISIWSG